ncbi:MAG: hypothetical protein KJT03_18555 [Verrucomicrobiae bacterium]|nr:hypothetical protein [Verrucomicrobiae bacterium]
MKNYHTFWKNLSVPLITVELSFGSAFELKHGEATRLIQIQAKDVLWQKERILHLALEALPPHCEAVAYLDADVVFERDDWAELSLEALEAVPLIQPFTDFWEPPPDYDLARFRRGVDAFSGRSLASLAIDGTSSYDLLRTSGARVRKTFSSAGGFAWVARRSLLDEHGFYDACVVGSGNHAIVAASYGVQELTISSLRMNEERTWHFLDWAEPYAQDVGGRVGCIEGALFHLWHGDLKDRQYRERHADFVRFDFDPYSDISIDENGCLQWSSDKPEMHQFVRDYFFSRKEDG